MKKLCVLFLSLFFTQPLWAELITQNITGACDVQRTFYADFSPNSYTCNTGYFLPANTLGCQICPAGFACAGGTFYFNESEQQGAIYNQNISANMNKLCATNSPNYFVADFTPNVHTCSPGYYLPMNVDECTICPANYLCVGGTYSFNETNDQGIEPCPENYYAPTGSDLVCYPHILHVGNDNVYLKETKTTVPALNIGIGNDVFYANMTTTQTPMNRDTTRQLKIEYDNNLYYICDDTVCGE